MFAGAMARCPPSRDLVVGPGSHVREVRHELDPPTAGHEVRLARSRLSVPSRGPGDSQSIQPGGARAPLQALIRPSRRLLPPSRGLASAHRQLPGAIPVAWPMKEDGCERTHRPVVA